MTSQHDCTLSTALLEQIASQGLDALPDLMRTIINAAMEAERQQHLGVGRYERSPERRGYANGFKPKTMTTRVGEMTFAVPQVRDGSFYPSALERGLRSERALTLALAEMYVQGVSTRRVAAITEQLCGVELSSSQVSRATAQLDPILEQWRTRQLGEITYLYLDARYEKVRQDGQVRDAAVLIATGVDRTGRRQVLGVSVSLSEQEVHWRQFMQGLVARGLAGGQSSAACRGNGVSFTSSRTLARMCRARSSGPRLQRTFGRSSRRSTGTKPTRCWPRRCRNTPKRRRA